MSWLKFPIELIDCFSEELSDSAKIVYAVMLDRAGSNCELHYKQATIAKACSKSLRTVNAAIKELEQAGLLRTLRTGRASYYKIVDLTASTKRKSPECADPELLGVGYWN